MKRKPLGRGLSALLSEPAPQKESAPAEAIIPPSIDPLVVADSRLKDVLIDSIVPNRRQPRQSFDSTALSELSESIKVHGILQPLVVRSHPDHPGQYELIAGERRLRAAKLAGLAEVPIVLHQVTDPEALELALVENLQRADLDPIEEAAAFQLLMRDFNLTQEEVADRVGRSRAAVANAVRLLHLSDSVQQMVASGTLSPGHARTLLSFEDLATQYALAQEIIQKGLSVRQTERLVQHQKAQKPSVKQKSTIESHKPNIHIADLERRLQQALKTRVSIKRESSGRVFSKFNSSMTLT